MKKTDKKIKEYFDKKKEIYDVILEFIESIENIETDFIILINNIDVLSIRKNQEELEHFLQMLLSISNDHHRGTEFLIRIERILEYFEKDIKQTFSKNEIFHIFMNNRRILLFLFSKGIITPDEAYVKYFCEPGEPNSPRLCHFFFPEIRDYLSDEKCKEIKEEMMIIDKNNFDKYEEKRLKGENDSYLCSLIRNDSVKEFISHFHKTNFSLNKKIEPSIFETNPFLIDKTPTLIEYSAFYGSIQIFTFILYNNVEAPPSLWIYSIHSKNPEMIHLLELNSIEPKDESYEECLEESIKCHHNDISAYIKDNLLTNIKSNSEDQPDIDERIISYGFKYYNYSYFPKEFKQKYLFYYMSKYNYSIYVKLFIRKKKKEIKRIKIDNAIMTQKVAKENKIYILYNFLSKQNKVFEKFFYQCKELKEISIPRSVKSIERCSFYECKSLVRISIPSTVKTIGSHAFVRCLSLTEIELPPSLESIGKSAFDGCSSLKQIKIPAAITKIEKCCFYGCTSLLYISIPLSIRVIEHHAFYGCSSLQKIYIQPLISSIEQSLFKKCTSMSQIFIENPFVNISIEKYSFDGCSSLKQITIPCSITSIGNFAFRECSSLTQITFEIPSCVTSIGDYAFSRCSSLTQITIPSSVTSIGNYAFRGCSSLTQIAIPSSVSSIGNYTFEGCSSFIQIIFEFPSSVTSIGDFAFSGCSSLAQITIPSSVTSIGSNAFTGCSLFICISFEISSFVIIYINNRNEGVKFIKKAIVEGNII